MHNKYKKIKNKRTKSYGIIYHMISVESRRVPIQALSPRDNWAMGHELGLACILEGRPKGQWAMEERKLDHPKYLEGGE